jgi:DNA-binding transcriptional ArsR family regulator
MIGLFGKTAQLYDVLANKTRLIILILLDAESEMDLADFIQYLGEDDLQNLGAPLKLLEKASLIHKRLSKYSLTGEGERRLAELGISRVEAIELAKERKDFMKSAYNNQPNEHLTADCRLELPAELRDILKAYQQITPKDALARE